VADLMRKRRKESNIKTDTKENKKKIKTVFRTAGHRWKNDRHTENNRNKFSNNKRRELK
jgi:hypothetical protein